MDQNKPNKTEVLFIRVEPRTLEAFEQEVTVRGLNKCEAARQLIAAWLRQPEVIPLGLPRQTK